MAALGAIDILPWQFGMFTREATPMMPGRGNSRIVGKFSSGQRMIAVIF